MSPLGPIQPASLSVFLFLSLFRSLSPSPPTLHLLHVSPPASLLCPPISSTNAPPPAADRFLSLIFLSVPLPPPPRFIILSSFMSPLVCPSFPFPSFSFLSFSFLHPSISHLPYQLQWQNTLQRRHAATRPINLAINPV